MRIRNNYRHTVAAAGFGYITQAIVNNFAPLLFITFHATYGISLARIGLLVSVNFGTQLLVDLFAAKFVDKIGYRASVIAAHILAALGLVGLGILPDLLPSAYAGLCIAVVAYAVGGGLIETVISPVVEACPFARKSATMSLLHSFYCWGSVLVILVSTLLFWGLGIDVWRIVAFAWAAVPLCNAVYFCFVPIESLTEEGEGMGIGKLLATKIFWVFALLMVCAGAAELAISQWASAFAETGLRVPKAVGDVAGPCLFAVLMGIARLIYVKIGGRVHLQKYIALCALLCVGSYLLAALSPWAPLSLVGCALCGFSVGVMWPGVYSLSSQTCPKGGTAMFALLALAGDCGCTVGPTVVGLVSGALEDNLSWGLLAAVIFPLVMLVGLWMLRRITAPKALYPQDK